MKKSEDMRKRVKTRIIRAAAVILIPVFLVLLIVVLLYLPFVQDFAARKVAQSVSESVGMNIHIGKFRLTYPFNLKLHDVYTVDANGDTILYVKELDVKLRLISLTKKELSVSRLNLAETRIQSKSLIEGMEINGIIGSLDGYADYISLVNEEVFLNHLKLSDTHLTVRIDSILSSESDGTTINRKFFVEDIQLDRISVAVLFPADSMQLATYIENAALSDGKVDLSNKRYEADRFQLGGATISYEIGNLPVKKGLDLSHILLSNVNANIDSILYQQNEMQALIQSFSAGERSGLEITAINGQIQMDEKNIIIPQCTLKTPYSTVSAQLFLPGEMSENNTDGFLSTRLTAAVGKKDLEFVMGELPNALASLRPDYTLIVSCWIEGTMNQLYLHELKSECPGIFQIDANGLFEELTDSVARAGTFELTATIQGKNILKEVIPKQYEGHFSLPDTVWITMQASLKEGNYAADLMLSELQGQMTFSGTYNPLHEEYFVDLKVDNIAPVHFLPEDSMMLLTASFQAEGKGTDVFADKTRTQFSSVLTEMQYKDMVFSGISFDGSLKDNQIQGAIASVFPYVKGNLTFDGNLQKERLAGIVILEMDTLDLYGMKVTEKPLSNSFQIFAELESDLQKRHQLDVTLGNWDMFLSNLTVSPKTLILHAKANEDTTRISLHAGDLGITLTGNADVATLTDKLVVVADSVSQQLKRDSLIDFQQLRLLYPQMNLRVEALRDNPVYNYLQENNIFFDRFDVNASASPDDGLKVNGLLLSLIKDTTRIDTVRLDVRQDTYGINYTFDVVKNRFRRQEAYQVGLKGSLTYGGGDVEMVYRDDRKETGLLVGVRAEKQPDGVYYQVFPENPILAYHPFTVNADNYIKVKNLKDISANLRLTGERNTLVWLHSIEEEGKMLELLTEVSSIDLNRISTRFLQMPSIQGMADMSVRYVPEDDAFMIVADATVNNLVYQGGRVGELLLSGVYLPIGNEEHQLDINLFHNYNEVSKLTARYQPANNERIEGAFDVNRMTLSTLNPFLDGMARLNGAIQSSMTLSGTAKQPLLNGYVQTDTASVYLEATGSRYRFDDKKVGINDNTIQFNRYGIYAAGNNPLTIDGKIDLNINNPVQSMTDLRMVADNMRLLDSRKTQENIVYGRMSVDLRNFTVRGPLHALVMRGNLNLLANTNMTYIMKESPLAVQDRMADLVTFTYFTDTIPRRRTLTGERMIREAGTVEGQDVLLAVHIDPGAKLTVELDEEGSDRIELEGGGDLSFQSTPQGDMSLTGRYSLSGGLIRYNMPVISHKTLRIKENSYIDWSGNPFDPYLNLRASERIRANVSTDGQSSRSVDFDAGIELRQRMENLSLQFTLEALDDASVQNRLTALGAEERSKRAVGLLLAGIYLDEDASGRIKLDMGTALNSFLQAEINQITGNLLRGVDFNFGMANDDRMGYGATNYSFRFAKRFYNDRLNVVLGGNVWTGNVPNDNNTFINDASLEYRLDPGGNRYAKLFYNRRYENLLEGDITKYGGGVVFRRKIRRLNELFLFRKRTPEIIMETGNNE